MEEKTREGIEGLNQRLSGLFPYKLEVVNPKDLRILEKNARYMSNEMFQNLVDNLKRDGALSSVPLCHREEDGGLRVLSGNHRVQAAVKAEIERVLIFVLEGDLSRDQLIAIQLSHNSIEGKDDPVLLKELWDEISDLEMKIYAGLDTETIRQLESMEFASISEARLDFKAITFLFLPEEEEKLKKVMDRVDEVLAGDGAYLLSGEHYKRVFDCILNIKDGYNIVNNPTAMMKIIELAESQMEGLELSGDKNHAKSEE